MYRNGSCNGWLGLHLAWPAEIPQAPVLMMPQIGKHAHCRLHPPDLRADVDACTGTAAAMAGWDYTWPGKIPQVP